VITPPRSPRPLSASQVLDLASSQSTRRHGCRILDLRGTEAPPTDHVPGSAWIPWRDALPVFLMPPRGEAVVVITAPDHARRTAGRITAAGWPASWSDEELPMTALRPGPPPGAAWDIDPLLREHLDRLPAPDTGPVLDLGSGSSREGVFLAQRGHDVLAVDRLPDALALARARAEHHGVRIRTLTRRVRRPEDLPNERFAVVLDLRFLRRPLLDALASITRPGGVLLLRTYGSVEPGEEPGGGPRNPRERLTVDEAARRLGTEWDWTEPAHRVWENGAMWIRAAGRRKRRNAK